MPTPTSILLLHDDKPGHLSQLEGLAHALEQQCAAQIAWQSVSELSPWQWSPPASLRPPDLLIGAGHATHRWLLQWGRYWRSFTAVIMRPSLPLNWFDAVICPQHDTPPARAHIFTSRIALNRMRPCQAPVPHAPPPEQHACILLGGPSKHFLWHEDRLTAQIDHLVATQASLIWRIVPSRRTPQAIISRLARQYPEALVTAPHLPLAKVLAEAGQAWVTPDSFSMISEALTLGVPCGVFHQLAQKGSRVARGVHQLQSEGWLIDAETWQHTHALPDKPPLNENVRAAKWLLQRWRLQAEPS